MKKVFCVVSLFLFFLGHAHADVNTTKTEPALSEAGLSGLAYSTQINPETGAPYDLSKVRRVKLQNYYNRFWIRWNPKYVVEESTALEMFYGDSKTFKVRPTDGAILAVHRYTESPIGNIYFDRFGGSTNGDERIQGCKEPKNSDAILKISNVAYHRNSSGWYGISGPGVDSGANCGNGYVNGFYFPAGFAGYGITARMVTTFSPDGSEMIITISEYEA